MSGIAGPAVSDRMKYGIKQSAVRSDNLLHNFKASNGRSFDVKLGNEIVFEIPAMGKGYYCDLATSYIRFGLRVTTSSDLTNANNATGSVRFARGPESLFRRLQIQDASGGLLETIENYNDLYAVTELCCNSSTKRKGLGRFHGEGWAAHRVTSVVQTAPIAGTPTQSTVRHFPLRFLPDLGSALYADATFAMDDTTEGDINGTMSTAPVTDTTTNTYDLVFTINTLSAIFGGGAEKYLPMSAINGVRLTFSLDDFRNAFVVAGYGIDFTSGTHATELAKFKASIYDPTYFLNMVQVDPMVDAELIAAATYANRNPFENPQDADAEEGGFIRIHTQGWQTFQAHVANGTTAMEHVIPVRVSSLKAIYFAFTPNTDYTGLESYDHVYNATSPQGIGNAMKSTFKNPNLADYVFYIDGKPTPATNVLIEKPYSEAISELQRSWHLAHKSAGTDHLSLLAGELPMYDFENRNFIMGQEFESFSNKSTVIESGKNTLNSNIQLRLRFKDTGADQAYTLKIFCLHDTFLTLEPGTGVMRNEI